MRIGIKMKFERTLKFTIGGAESSGKLVIGPIEWSAEREKWGCRWSIDEIHPETGVTYGLDPLDALTKTLDFLSSLIRGSEEDGLVLCWLNPQDHGGLMFPHSEGQFWRKVPPNYKGELPAAFTKKPSQD
jgi:hypothetical protein